MCLVVLCAFEGKVSAPRSLLGGLSSFYVFACETIVAEMCVIQLDLEQG
jgi:hypothetical protein